MKVAVLSNTNLEPLGPTLGRLGHPVVHFAGFGQYQLELLDPASALASSGAELVWLHLDAEEWLKDRFYELPDRAVLDHEWAQVWTALEAFLARHPRTTLVVSSLELPPSTFLTGLDANSPFSLTAALDRLNERLREAAQASSNVFVLEMREVVKATGYANLVDAKYWYLGRIRYSMRGFEALGTAFARVVAAICGESRKVLVLDLDNTLWGGVIGEDGVAGIALGEDGVGKAYRDFQKGIRALKQIGVLLALNSKNNEADVAEAFERHPMMVLRPADFVTRKVNWTDKVSNLRAIAADLDLGEDSFVFLDDNPVERDIVRQNLPGVAVPDFPKDPTALPTWLLRDVVPTYFPRVRLTGEDRERTAQYRARDERRQLGVTLDKEAFLRSLGIKLTLSEDPGRHVARVAQLTQKTNQFNLTTRRYTEADISAMLRDPGWAVYTLEYADRFGTEGLTAVLLARVRGASAEIDTLLMSCRIIGRDVEREFVRQVARRLRERGVARVTATYIPTKKNVIAASLYDGIGFAPQPSDDDASRRYAATVDDLLGAGDAPGAHFEVVWNAE